MPKDSVTKKTEEIIAILGKEFRHIKPVISKADPLDILIATMLSQNTTDKTSYRAFMNLKKDFGGWEDVMNSNPTKIKKSIRVCGLANQKALSIKKLLQELNKNFGELSLKRIRKMTDEEIYSEFLKYKGVGVKTISCVLAFSLGRDVFPVDTHIHRLCNRLGLAKTKSPVKTFERVKDKIPNGKKFLLHTMLIRYGRKICKAKNPLCSKCSLYELCEFEDKELYASRKNVKASENNFIILEHV